MTKFMNYINEGKNEQYFETASCCGIFLKNSEEKELLNILNNNSDFDIGIDILNNIIKNNKGDWIQNNFNKSSVPKDSLIKQALGMKKFIDNHVKFPVKGFISKSIKKYYNQEKKVFNLGKGKENTSDLVLCNDNIDNFFSNFTKESIIDIDTKNGVVTANNIKFVQVSLKASGESKLGNVKTFLKRKGLDLNEGFISNIFYKINSFFSKLINKVSNVLKKYQGKKINVNKYVFENYNSDEIYFKIFNKINKLEKMGKENGVPILIDKSLNKKNELDEKELFFLIHNHISLKLAIDIINILKKEPDFLKQMVADGYFGLTNLPLWIVYGYGKEPKYLGLKKDYSIEDIIEEKMFIKINPNRKENNWFVINFYILGGLTDDMKKMYYNLGTMPKPSTGAFAVEFRSEKKYIPLDKSAYNL